MFFRVLQQQRGTGQQQQRLNQPDRHRRRALRSGPFWGRSGKPYPALTSRDSDFTATAGSRGTPLKSQGRSGLQTALQPHKHACHGRLKRRGGLKSCVSCRFTNHDAIA